MVTQPFRLWHLRRALRFRLPPLQTSDRARSSTPEVRLGWKYLELLEAVKSDVTGSENNENEM